MSALKIGSVSIAHPRLEELFRLADAAEPYYRWLEKVACSQPSQPDSLNGFLMNADQASIEVFIQQCQANSSGKGVPQVFDGIGRPYASSKALYFMLAWIVRDAPQQRLQPLLSQLVRGGMGKLAAERTAIAALIHTYRSDLKSFEWDVVREVIADRLEGSRRSLRGRMAEAAVRSLVAETLATERTSDGHYGRFTSARLSDGEVLIGGHAFDVCLYLSDDDGNSELLVLPVKSRETQGGGHANLFSRDIEAAMTALKGHISTDFSWAWMIPVIIAENWHADQVEQVREVADGVVLINENPNQVETLPDDAAEELRGLIRGVLDNARTIPDALDQT